MRHVAFNVRHNRKKATGIDLPPISGIFDGSDRRILSEYALLVFR